MRQAALALAFLLSTWRAPAATVEIAPPDVHYHAGDGTPCPLNRQGCATLATEFRCACVEHGSRWTLLPHIVVQPAIYMTTDDVLHHEMLHIADVRTSLHDYAASLLLRTFETHALCNAFVDEVSRTFADRLALIQRDTAIRRDGVFRPVSSPTLH